MPRLKKIILVVNILLWSLSLAASVILFVAYQREMQGRRQIAFEFGKQKCSQEQQVINTEMQSQMALATRLANDLTNERLAYTDLSARLRQDLENKPNLFGLGVAFEPYVYKPDLRLYAPYYRKDDQGKFTRVQVETFYDYTDKSDPDSSEWYYGTLEGGPRWYYSTFDSAAQAVLIEYYVPFYRNDPQTGQQVPIGMVYVDHSVETIKAIVQSVDISEEGYAALFNNEGIIVVHPQASLIGKTVQEAAEIIQDPDFVQNATRAQNGEDFYRERVSANRIPSWTFYKPLQVSGWFTACVMPQNAFDLRAETIIRWMIWIGAAAMIFLIFSAALIFRADRGSEKVLWAVSLIASAVFFGGLVWIWAVIDQNPLQEPGSIVLINDANIEQGLEDVRTNLILYGVENPLRIPTGIMIQSMNIGANEATFSGYIWQKYPIDRPAGMVEGVQFLDDLSGASLEEVYRFQKGGYEVVGWFFIANLKQSFHIENFPLDQVNATIRLLPKVLNQNIILTPDLNDYDFTAPSHNPGLASDLVLADFRLEHTFFSYQLEPYNAGLGGAAQVQRNVIPPLTYNICTVRNILSPLIAFCITIVVVSGLMFGSILVKLDSAYSALSNAAGLFFVVAITHVGLRSTVNASGVVYLEYLFIILYIFILGLAVNGLVAYSENPPWLITYKDNLIAKLTFVPLLMSFFFLVTVAAFYPRNSFVDTPPDIQAALATKNSLPTSTPGSALPTEGVAPTDSSAPAAKLPQSTPVKISVNENTVTLRYVIDAGPITIDPSLSSTVFDSNQIDNLFMGLTRLEAETNQVLPSLALTWTVSADGLTWTFSLRQDVPWVQYQPQSGEARQVVDFNGQIRYVNGRDVIYGIQRALTSGNPAAANLDAVRNAGAIREGKAAVETLGLKAVDDWTLQFTLEKPAPYFAQLLSYDVSYPAPRWVIEEWQKDWIRVENVQTNGPYLLGSLEKQQIQLLKNPFWPNAKQVQIEQVVETISQDAENILTLYRKDQVDGTSGLDLAMIQTARSDTLLTKELVFAPELCTRYLGFINTKPPFDSPLARRAFSLAIDRQEIIRARQRGNLLAATFAPPGVFGAVTDSSLGIVTDPTLARQVFQQYLDELSLTLADFNSAYPIRLGHNQIQDMTVSEIAAKNWQDVLGVKVTTENVPPEEFYTFLAKDSPIDQTFNLFEWGWCADYPDQNNFLYTVFHSQNGINQVRRNCADPLCQSTLPDNEFDRLVATAGQAADPAVRLDLYAQAERLLVYEEAAIAPLYYGAQAHLTKPWLERTYPNMGAPDFWNWRIKPR